MESCSANDQSKIDFTENNEAKGSHFISKPVCVPQIIKQVDNMTAVVHTVSFATGPFPARQV